MSNETLPDQNKSARPVPGRSILAIVLPALLASVTLSWWGVLAWFTGHLMGTW